MTGRILVIGAVMVAMGFLVAASGIIPIKASSGHWAVTEWLLQFAKRRSIATHSLGTEVPPIDDPDLVLKGALHYEIGCRSCHGSPGARQPRIALNMLPPPPALPRLARQRSPQQLFQVVKHGLKFTGMPAWPAPSRDDEVWAVVAFLKKLPELDASEYREFVQAPPATAPIETLGVSPRIPKPVTESCARCHGREGIARGHGAFPHLAGQRHDYLLNAIDAYARGERHSGIMEPIAAGLTPETVHELARYYANLTPALPAPRTAQDRAAIERGRVIATEGLREQRVPACAECHEPHGRRAKPAYPSLAGQPAMYLELQLQLFKDGYRGGSAYAHLMKPVAQRLTPEQRRDVAAYFASLPLGHGGEAEQRPAADAAY